MTSHSRNPTNHTSIRASLLAFALILSCISVWLLTVSYFRFFSEPSKNTETALIETANQNEAAAAASFGLVRGDLWAAYALTYFDMFLGNEHPILVSSKAIEKARRVTDRALGLAPYDARLWLLLASIDSRFDWLNRKSSLELRMSYYTGANAIELVPYRISLAVNSSEIGDPDFQLLVSHDVGIIMNHKPHLIPKLISIYRDAPPPGRQFLETTIKEIDRSLAEKLLKKD